MALEIRDRREENRTAVLSHASIAHICLHKRTFCAPQGDAMRDICPNRDGELVARPRGIPASVGEPA
ncbi:DUF1272 domain-containing protein [Kitasatospora sp. GAS1066B]|uniref:DUF1272 domain-containing protein n=1 Tax=Kitasatospora sp. GAS1066B TaxID=3156271 RepID=UPI0035184723